MGEQACVTGLYYYPVKSLRGIAAARARLAETGLQWDRHWMVVDGSGRFLTQRTHPHMARIVPAVDDGGRLTLSAPQLPALTLPPLEGARLAVTIWDDACEAYSQSPQADAWLTRALGEPVRLVRARAGMRAADLSYAGVTQAPIGFPDGFPLLICNQASLADLNTRLPQALPMERFRPNLVLAGLEPWEEDRIQALQLNGITLRLVKPCTRCSIPSIDHLTGEPSVNPLPVLKRFRHSPTLHGVMFGENAVIEAGVGRELRCGTACEVRYDT